MRTILFFLLLYSVGFCQAQVLVKKQVMLMGSVFEITIVDEDSVAARMNIDEVVAEVSRIENLISEWQPTTQISAVNKYAGIKPVKVDREVFELTKRAITYSKMTEGAFDISVAALDNIWIFDGTMDELPSVEAVGKSIEKVGYQYIELDSLQSTIFLSRQGMKIGFGSIGKGYAADRGRALMIQKGITGGIVNASGDISCWGTQPHKKPWVIGVNNPFKPHRIIKKLKLTESAVATSGSYQKFAEIHDIRYSHIIDPKTGYPSTGITSVTVVGPSAEFANALSTGVMVLGEKAGLALLKQYKEYKYILILDNKRVLKGK